MIWCTSPSTLCFLCISECAIVQVYNGMVYNSIFTVLILHVYNGMVYISIITVFSEYITVYLFYRSMMVWWTSPSSHCVYHVYPRVLCAYQNVNIVLVYEGMVYISIITVFSVYIIVYFLYRCTIVWCTSPSSLYSFMNIKVTLLYRCMMVWCRSPLPLYSLCISQCTYCTVVQ